MPSKLAGELKSRRVTWQTSCYDAYLSFGVGTELAAYVADDPMDGRLDI